MALTPVETALARVLDGIAPVGVERVPLAAANGRVLAEDLRALRTQPPFDAAAMDGWALVAADAAADGARLAIVGESAAGRGFAGTLGSGEAIRIFTGAPMPAGADTVVMQEYARRDGDTLILDEAARPGRHVRRAGVDFREGEIGLAAGRRLDFAALGLAAGLNHAVLPVHRRPRIAYLANGDELVPPGTVPGPDRIVASNGVALAALIAENGGEPVDLGIAPDDLDAIRAAVRAGLDADIDALVTLAGASVGDHDLVHRALTAEGVVFEFWKIAMRPGKPLMAGRRGTLPVLGLPGNPAASLVCGLVFVAPLVRALAGRLDAVTPLERVATAVDLAANDLRQDYLRATLAIGADGRAEVRPLDSQDSSLLTRFAGADALLVRPPHAEATRAGDLVPVMRLR